MWREDQYDIRDVHLTFEGDAALALSYVPFAESKLLNLLREDNDHQVRTYMPDKGVLIRLRIIGEQRFIHIEATRGCTDRPGFLLSRRAQAYDALYVDGTLENINPITGTPRPEPDPAVKTKGYKVPQDLQRLGLDRLSASRYSGLMRLAVGCLHAAGRESPFRPEHQITHGIVKTTVRENNKDVDKYWVVEIRQEGVFVAPIANTGRCCDSWDVSGYMPRPPSPPGQPLLPKPTTLSLRVRYLAKDKRVLQIVTAAQMAPVYASGTPFYSAHGWAFSASGAHAQCVVQNFLTTPAKHFECSRWRIDFEAAGEQLGATVTLVENKKPATFKRNSVVWVPISSGVWLGSFGAGSTDIPDPIAQYSSQDAPIAVYYVGETEVVLRWGLSYRFVPFFEDPTVYAPVEVRLPDITDCPYGPGSALGPIYAPYDFSNVHGGTRISAHNASNSGFYCFPFFDHRAEEGTASVDKSTTKFQMAPDAPVRSYSNFYTLHPNCYYINSSGNLVTACSSTFEYQATERQMNWNDRFQGTETQATNSSVVIFPEEREAFLGVHSEGWTQSGQMRYRTDGVSGVCQRVWEKKVDGGPCPGLDFESARGTNYSVCLDSFPENYPETIIDPAYGASGGSGRADIVVADHTDTSGVEEWRLQTFLQCNPNTKPTAESDVRAMHGNLYYADDKLKPPDQRGNMVYVLNVTQVVIGGFQPPADPAGFVGRA